MCFLQSTVRAEVTFVSSTKGIESSGNNSGAHGKLEQASRAWAMPGGARLRGSVQWRSRKKADEDSPWARGARPVVMATVTGLQWHWASSPPAPRAVPSSARCVFPGGGLGVEDWHRALSY